MKYCANSVFIRSKTVLICNPVELYNKIHFTQKMKMKLRVREKSLFQLELDIVLSNIVFANRNCLVRLCGCISQYACELARR